MGTGTEQHLGQRVGCLGGTHILKLVCMLEPAVGLSKESRNRWTAKKVIKYRQVTEAMTSPDLPKSGVANSGQMQLIVIEILIDTYFGVVKDALLRSLRSL